MAIGNHAEPDHLPPFTCYVEEGKDLEHCLTSSRSGLRLEVGGGCCSQKNMNNTVGKCDIDELASKS